jgi:hypothetical protein
MRAVQIIDLRNEPRSREVFDRRFQYLRAISAALGVRSRASPSGASALSRQTAWPRTGASWSIGDLRNGETNDRALTNIPE